MNTTGEMPRRLLTKAGKERRVPAFVDRVMRCPTCNTLLESSGEWWGCPRVLGHVRLLHDAMMAERIDDANKVSENPSRWKGVNVIRFVKARQRYEQHKKQHQ